MNSTYGIRVIFSPYVAPPGTVVPFPDWRERLHRNLTPGKAGVWGPLEPLTYEPPSAFLMGGDLFVNPMAIASLTGLEVES